MKKLHSACLLIFWNILFFTSSVISQTICISETNSFVLPAELPGCAMCAFTTYTGSTYGQTTNQPLINTPCPVENSRWISFYSQVNKVFRMEITADSCEQQKGVEVVIFKENLNPITSCLIEKPTGDKSTFEVQNLVPRGLYHIMIDGIDGDKCNFTLKPVGGINISSSAISDLSCISPDCSDICIGVQRTYSVAPHHKPMNYHWEIPDLCDVVEGGGLLDSFVTVETNNTGTDWIRVTSAHPCIPTVSGLERRFQIVSKPFLTSISETIALCEEDLPITYKGIFIDSFKEYRQNLQNDEGCEYPLILTVDQKKFFYNNYDTIVCPGNCVMFDDSCYFFSSPDTVDIYCSQLNGFNVVAADTSNFEPNCFVDTFLNALAIDWNSILGAQSYQIYIDNELISEQPHSSFIYPILDAGSSIEIKVIPQNQLGCNFQAGKITCLLPDLTSGISESKKQPKILVFPNPTQGVFKVETDFEIEKIAIFDVTGNQIPITAKSFSNYTEVENFSQNKGIYFLKIYSKNQTFIKKVILH